jgi:hypothetical protein
VNRTPSEEPPVHVSRLGSSQNPRAGPSESAQQAGGDSSDKSEYSSDSEATEVAAEATISVATWNMVSASTLGVRGKKKPKGHSIRRAHTMVREWCQQRRTIWGRIRQLLPSQRELRLSLERELKPLSNKIKRRLRAQQRVEQQQALDRVEQLRRGQLREHWQQLKRVGNMQPSVLAVPAAVLDAGGVEQGDAAEVRRQWQQAWAQLAEHRADDKRYSADFHSRVERGECIEAEASAEERASAAVLNNDITLEEVHDSLQRLHRGKAVGCDGVSAEVLKEGGPAMVESLHYLCSLAFIAADVPMDWLRGVVVPLHKDGDRRAPLNYRPITLLSLVGKVYTGVLCERLTQWAEQRGVIVPEQGGFRAKRGCPEQVFALTELIKMRQRQKKDTYACFIDIKKAYDTVWHAGLQAKLKQYGIHGRMHEALSSLYAGCESTIRLGGVLGHTEFFPIETGVRQGCILSPLLYSLFINGAAVELKGKLSACGVPVGPHARLTLLLYADDIVLLSESEAGVSQLMAALHAYSVLWRFEINHAKCGLMCFRWAGSRLPTSHIRLGGQLVAWVPTYKYLGIELHCGVAFKQYRKRALLSAQRAANAVSGMGMYSGKLGVPLGVQVYKAMVRPLLEYCAEVTSMSAWKDAEQLQASMAKRILGVTPRTSSTAARGELGWMSMDGRWQKARVIFWGKLQLMPASSPARIVYEASAAAFALEGAMERLTASTPLVAAEDGWKVVYAAKEQRDPSLPWCAQLLTDVAQLGEPLQKVWRNPALLSDDDEKGLLKWRQMVTKAVRTREQYYWWRCVQERPTLSVYAQLKRSAAGLVQEAYLSAPHGGWNDLGLVGRKALTRIRCGHHELRCCTGAWQGIDAEDRWCPLCAGAAETEQHFLLDCTCFEQGRARLYAAADAMVRAASTAAGEQCNFSMQQLSRDEQWCLLTGGSHRSIAGNALKQRVTALVLAAIAQWTLERKSLLTAVEEARQLEESRLHH